MKSEAVARVTAIDCHPRAYELIDIEFEDAGEARRFYLNLVESEDVYDNVCLWSRGRWHLVEQRL